MSVNVDKDGKIEITKPIEIGGEKFTSKWTTFDGSNKMDVKLEKLDEADLALKKDVIKFHASALKSRVERFLDELEKEPFINQDTVGSIGVTYECILIECGFDRSDSMHSYLYNSDGEDKS